MEAAPSLAGTDPEACFVAPGLDFADFDLPRRAELLREFPAHVDLVRQFTR